MLVYFISGLGADKRAFKKLTLPENWTIIHLDWLDIADTETLKSYVLKFSKLIDKSKPFCLAGLSFGGIIATELTKILNPQKTIIISSIATKHGLPLTFRFMRLTGFNKIIPATFLNRVYPLTDWYFGTKTREEKALIRQIIHDTPPLFLKWAINEILHWTNEIKPEKVYHIHGTKDNILPYKKVKADLLIEGGRHFMVYSKADEISGILIDKLGES